MKKNTNSNSTDKEHNVFIYLDDILVASDTPEQHFVDLQTVFSVLSKYKLRISLHKCAFFQDSLTFVVYNISSSGIKPPLDKISAISNFSMPVTSTELRRFLGMINFFRHMISNFANIAYHVTELIRLNPVSKNLPWTNDSKLSFNNLKHALSSAPTLTVPSSGTTEYQLVTDSSSFAAGAALDHMVDGQPSPVGFFSQKLSAPQKVYSTFDRELLAAYLAVLHFRSYIDGQVVTFFYRS